MKYYEDMMGMYLFPRYKIYVLFTEFIGKLFTAKMNSPS